MGSSLSLKGEGWGEVVLCWGNLVGDYMIFSISCCIGLDVVLGCSGACNGYHKKFWFSASFGISACPCSGDGVDDFSALGVDSDAVSVFVGDEDVDWREDFIHSKSAHFISKSK